MKKEVRPSWSTGNYSLTTALGSLGFGWLEPEAPCTNTYGEHEVVNLDKNGVPDRPGKVTFHLLRSSEEFPGMDISKLVDEWREGIGDETLDDLLAVVASDSAEVIELKKAIREALPFALIQYFKGLLKNRKTVSGAWRTVPPMRQYQEDGASVSISVGASDKLKHDLGVKL